MLDLTKPVQTRAGNPARIVCTNRKMPGWTLLVLVEEYGVEAALCYTLEGKVWPYTAKDISMPTDLVNSSRRQGYINIYDNDTVHLMPSIDKADEYAAQLEPHVRRVARIYVEWEV